MHRWVGSLQRHGKIYDDWSVHVELYAQMTTRLCCLFKGPLRSDDKTLRRCAKTQFLHGSLSDHSFITYSAVHSDPGYAYAVELPESASLVRTGQALHKPCCCSSQPRTCQLSVSCVSSSDVVNCSPVNNWNCCFLLVDQRRIASATRYYVPPPCAVLPSCYSTLACVPT